MKRTKEHNTRQWALHNYLKNHPFDYTHHIDLLCELKEHYFEPHLTDLDIRAMDLYYSPVRTLLSNDLRALKKSLVIKRILIGNSKKGVKYATKEEAEEYFKRQDESIKRRCIQNNMQRAKYGLDGQYVLQFTGNEKPMIESVTNNEM